MNIWNTSPSGYVVVNGEIPRIADGIATVYFRTRVMRWAHCVAVASVVYRVPVPWILGTIWAESSGDPGALSADGGYGLMQLTSKAVFQGVPPEDTRDDPKDFSDDVLDPARNIVLGTALLAKLREWNGEDLIRCASGYNGGVDAAGHPHPSVANAWGLRETSGYIDRVVQGSNSAIDELPRVPGCYTWEYIRQWQREIGVNPDGKFGPATLTASRLR